MQPRRGGVSWERFAAEEERRIADLDALDVRHVDHDLVHADAAGDGGFLSFDDDVSLRAVGADVAIGIADWQRRDDALALRILCARPFSCMISKISSTLSARAVR